MIPAATCTVNIHRAAPVRPDELLETAVSFSPASPSRVPEPGMLLCSPQPFLGGDLDNNVIAALATSFARTGRPAFRFNYRSVGASRDVRSGQSRFEYWKGVEELRDHDAVLADAIEALRRARRLFEVGGIVGYSFGAHVALRLAMAESLDLPLVLIAPPLGKLDFSALVSRTGRTLIIVARDDVLDPPLAVGEIERRFPRAQVMALAHADHFLRGEERLVSALAIAFVAGDSFAEPNAPADRCTEAGR